MCVCVCVFERVGESLSCPDQPEVQESAGGGGWWRRFGDYRCFLCSTSEVPHSFIRLSPLSSLPLTWSVVGVCVRTFGWVNGGGGRGWECKCTCGRGGEMKGSGQNKWKCSTVNLFWCIVRRLCWHDSPEGTFAAGDDVVRLKNRVVTSLSLEYWQSWRTLLKRDLFKSADGQFRNSRNMRVTTAEEVKK